MQSTPIQVTEKKILTLPAEVLNFLVLGSPTLGSQNPKPGRIFLIFTELFSRITVKNESKAAKVWELANLSSGQHYKPSMCGCRSVETDLADPQLLPHSADS